MGGHPVEVKSRCKGFGRLPSIGVGSYTRLERWQRAVLHDLLSQLSPKMEGMRRGEISESGRQGALVEGC